LWCISDTATYTRIVAQRRYEISNHLGNVLATVLDRKTVTTGTTTGTVIDANTASIFRADIATATDYYAFGQPMPTRDYKATWSSTDYRYGMNTQEESPELQAFHTTALYWEYDSRIGRRWNVDQLENIGESGYACFGNNPIFYNDINGDTKDGGGDGAVVDASLQKALGIPEPVELPAVVIKTTRINKNDKTLDRIQLGLAAASFIPGVATVAGISNAVIDIYRGNYVSAGFNLITAIPIAGTGVKWINGGITLLKNTKVIKTTLQVVNNAKVIKTLAAVGAYTYKNLPKVAGWQLHHIIPQALLKNPKIENALIAAGFDIDDMQNLMYLENIFHTNHPAYNKFISDKLIDLIDSSNGLTIQGIQTVISDASVTIQNGRSAWKSAGGTLANNLNEYIKTIYP
jgi:A nuclease family of the HNH/ENDO VII superfamily with conserved AHH